MQELHKNYESTFRTDRLLCQKARRVLCKNAKFDKNGKITFRLSESVEITEGAVILKVGNEGKWRVTGVRAYKGGTWIEAARACGAG